MCGVFRKAPVVETPVATGAKESCAQDTGGVSVSQRVPQHPVSWTNGDARSLISAAMVPDVCRDDETPGVVPENLSRSPR